MKQNFDTMEPYQSEQSGPVILKLVILLIQISKLCYKTLYILIQHSLS